MANLLEATGEAHQLRCNHVRAHGMRHSSQCPLMRSPRHATKAHLARNQFGRLLEAHTPRCPLSRNGRRSKVRGKTREKGGNPEKCVRGFPVLHSEADPGGTSRKTVFLERELGNGRQAARLRLSRLDRAPRSGWLTGQPVFRLGQAGRMAN